MHKITFFEDKKMTAKDALNLLKKQLEEVFSDIEDEPIPYENNSEAEFNSFAIYNDLRYKGEYYDIYGQFFYKKESYEECRIFLTLFVEKEGQIAYKDTMEESDISALVEYFLEIEELVYVAEKENERKCCRNIKTAA